MMWGVLSVDALLLRTERRVNLPEGRFVPRCPVPGRVHVSRHNVT